MPHLMTDFSAKLLDWYDTHARTLPWRIPPDRSVAGIRPDPYHVWMSEVMLQQTTVAAVIPYFEKFLRRWPTLQSLADASAESVMTEWAGLGYYSRARNLKACAEMLVGYYGGQFPKTAKELKKLPGIGDYTAGAIATIAFGECVPVVDGNIERVVTRQEANTTILPNAKQDCMNFMQWQTPDTRPGDFVQAMMDLGATICTPTSPSCLICPVNGSCLAGRANEAEKFPVRPPKKEKPLRKGAVFVAISGGHVWLVRRTEKGLLGGTAGLPTTNWTARQDGETGPAAAPFAADWQQQGSIRHTFTHFHLELEVWTSSNVSPKGEGWWGTASELPTVFSKAVRLSQATVSEERKRGD